MRFAGFEDEWKEYSLSDLFTSVKGKDLSKNSISEDGINKCILYGELYTTYNELITDIKSKTNEDKGVLSKNGDILVPCSTTTKGEDLVTASVLFEDNVRLGGDINILRKKKDSQIDEMFFAYYFSSALKKSIYRLTQGSTIIHLYWNHFKKVKMSIPSLEEQNKIANLFLILDKKVELLEKKYREYQCFKKYLMQKLFAQELRFDFDEIRLKSISKINKGKQLNKEHMLEIGKFYVLNGGQEPSGYTDSWNTSENTITISEGGNSCGFVNFNTEKFWSGGHCYYLNKLSENIDVYYLYSYLKFIEPQIMRLRVGSGLPNIQKGDIENIKIKILPKKEQIKISNLLLSTDNKISSIESQKDSFEIFKKGLLQQMFVVQLILSLLQNKKHI